MTAAPPESSGSRPSDGGPDRRLWVVVGTIVVVGFVAVVVSSTKRATMPVGASGSMSGMAMPGSDGSGMRMSMRDIDGRTLRVPDGRRGLVVFVQPRSCRPCVDAVRAAAQAVRGARSPTQLTVISVDATSSRDDMTQFALRAGEPRARYVVDDRNGALASMYDVSNLGATVLYDARGTIVARPATRAGLQRALARTGRPRAPTS